MEKNECSSELSRRNFMRWIGAGTAAVATLPKLTRSAFAQQTT
jgi:hypothetical protein